tara:strand:- start:301 stop:432 length:132 start_codon:yes stop_codon:yes gene_type:complete
MDKLIIKILISLTVVLFLFIIYLGTSDFVLNPRLVESEFSIEK